MGTGRFLGIEIGDDRSHRLCLLQCLIDCYLHTDEGLYADDPLPAFLVRRSSEVDTLLRRWAADGEDLMLALITEISALLEQGSRALQTPEQATWSRDAALRVHTIRDAEARLRAYIQACWEEQTHDYGIDPDLCTGEHEPQPPGN